MFANSGFWQLQMVLEPNNGRCANEEVEPRRGVDTRRFASKDAGPQRYVDWEVPYRLEKGMSASEDIGLRREVDCEIPTSIGERNEAFLIRMWKPLPSSRRVLRFKTLKGSSEGKA